MTWLIPADTLAAYTGAAIVLVLVPGPAQALILTRSIERGATAGVVTALGLDLATMVHSCAAALGLSAILATSATAFTAVKFAGAAYLIWLGLRMLWTRSGRRPAGVADTTNRVPARPRGLRLVGDGFLTGLLNPKVALFFLAFLPQFVHPERGHVVIQFLLLGGILALLDLLWAMILSAAVAHAHLRFTGPGRFAAWRDRVAGGVLVALGVKLAFTRR
jgi:threonine/homoserine/homoserine lactone efflux protein